MRKVLAALITACLCAQGSAGPTQAILAGNPGGMTPNLTVVSFGQSIASPTVPWASIGLTVEGQLQTAIGTGTYPTGSSVTDRDPQWSNFAADITDYGQFFEIRLDVQAGNSPTAGSSDTGTWIGLEGAVLWILQGVAGPSERSGTWRISIRRKGSATLDSADYSIAANSVPA